MENVKFVNESVKFLGVSDRVEHVEICGRICYKSEDRITDTSAAKFVKGLIKAEHLAMVEHATYSLHVPAEKMLSGMCDHGTFLIKDLCCNGDSYIVSGNVRAWRNFLAQSYYDTFEFGQFVNALYWNSPDNFDVFFGDLFLDYEPDVLDIPQRDLRDIYVVSETDIIDNLGLSEVAQLRHIFRTFLITCDRGVTHELVRHRPASFAQESTRYCNYSGEIQFILPFFWNKELTDDSDNARHCRKMLSAWELAMYSAADTYKKMIDAGAKPQEARSVLPNSLKTEIIMTANVEEWDHVLMLRTAPSAHPQIRRVMEELKIQLGYSF